MTAIGEVALRIVDAVVNSDVHHEMRQDRVGSADESTTPAHTLLRMDAGVRVNRGGLVHNQAMKPSCPPGRGLKPGVADT